MVLVLRGTPGPHGLRALTVCGPPRPSLGQHPASPNPSVLPSADEARQQLVKAALLCSLGSDPHASWPLRLCGSAHIRPPVEGTGRASSAPHLTAPVATKCL